MNDTLTFHDRFSDGSIDHSNPNGPGFRFLDHGDASAVAAHDAYEARRKAVDYRTRRKQAEADGKPTKSVGNPTPEDDKTLSADAARALADKAWADRNQRMANAWRTRE
jgi:hypothetical protein